jgi:hypothetical protein
MKISDEITVVLEYSERFVVELRVSIGSQLFDERQNERRDFIAAIEDRLLRRSLFLASRPGWRR